MTRRRATLVLEIGLSAVAVALFLGVTMGSSHRAGAAVDRTTTTTCSGLFCRSTTVPTVPPTSPPTTSPPATTAPPQTSPATTATPRTIAPTRQTYITTPTTAATTTTVAPIPGIGGHLPVSASTLPFTTKQQSAHVNPVFAALSGAGFLVALVIIGVRFLLTRPGRR